MNYKEAMDFISSYSKSGKPVKDLSRAEELMNKIGNPEKQLKFIHIAGTNGKGSVVEYISNALIKSGYSTGQFTSPFVLHYADRIRINGEEIDEASVCAIAEEVKKCVGANKDYSQFEITMAIAFLWYVREKCDIVVLEAGIGGKLDCTNVIPPPLLSVITSVSLDHTALLGDTAEKIAVQKSGIIKKNSAVVLSMDNKDSVCEIVRKKAEEENAEFILCDYSELMSISETEFRYKDRVYQQRMPGRAQQYNAAAAVEACRYISCKGFETDEKIVAEAVAETYVSGRIQYIKDEVTVIVDGGHNPAGIENLSCHLKSIKTDKYTVMGMIDTKDYEFGVQKIAECSEYLFSVDGFASNSVSSEKIAEIAGEYTSSEACASFREAYLKAKKLAAENGGTVVVCGSLYAVSEFLNNYKSYK